MREEGRDRKRVSEREGGRKVGAKHKAKEREKASK